MIIKLRKALGWLILASLFLAPHVANVIEYGFKYALAWLVAGSIIAAFFLCIVFAACWLIFGPRPKRGA